MTVSPIEKKIQNLSLQSVLNPKWFSTRGDYMETPKKDNGGIETKRTIKVRKQSPDDKAEDKHVPLAAKDSKWAGIEPSNSNSGKGTSDEEDVVRIIDASEQDEPPIFVLFPALKEKMSSIPDESLQSLTKLLVGESPDFTLMKTAKKTLPVQRSLPMVQETSSEESSVFNFALHPPPERDELSSKVSADSSATQKGSRSTTVKDAESTDEGCSPMTKSKKRTKRKPLAYDNGSSYSGLNRQRKYQHNRPGVMGREIETDLEWTSSHGSLADDEAETTS